MRVGAEDGRGVRVEVVEVPREAAEEAIGKSTGEDKVLGG